MACKFYNNNGLSCGGCVNFIKSTSVALSGTVLTITIPEMVFNNHDKICLCIIQNLPSGITANTTVSIQSGSSTFQVQTKLGNLLYADSIRTRKIYPLFIATDTNLFVLQDLCKLCSTDHVFPQISTAQTTTPTTASQERDF